MARLSDLPFKLKLNEESQRKQGDQMAKKISNLKIVEQQTEAELQAKYERAKAAKQRDEEEDSWRLARPEITARARALRTELEAARARLEGMTFDVVTDDMPHSLGNYKRVCVTDLVDAFDPLHSRSLQASRGCDRW